MVGVQDIGGVTTLLVSSSSGGTAALRASRTLRRFKALRETLHPSVTKNICHKKKTQNPIDADSALNHVSESSQ
jgi:hypothetical protein